MSKKDRESAVGLLLMTVFFGAITTVVEVVSQSARPRVYQDRTDLVSLDKLSVANIGELPPGHLAAMLDHQLRYGTGILATCNVCGSQFDTGPANTHLIVYRLDPQHTHRQHTCPGNHQVTQRIVGMNNLTVYLQAGCRIIIRSDSAEDGIRQRFPANDGTEATVNHATTEQMTIHAIGINVELRNRYDGLAQLVDLNDDPILADAILPTV